MSIIAFLKPQQLINWLFSFHGLSRGPLYQYKAVFLSLPDSLFLFRRTSVSSLNRDCLPSLCLPLVGCMELLGHPPSHSTGLTASCLLFNHLPPQHSIQAVLQFSLVWSSIYFSFPKRGGNDESEAKCHKWLGVEEEQGLQGEHDQPGNHHSSVTASRTSWGEGPACKTSFYKGTHQADQGKPVDVIFLNFSKAFNTFSQYPSGQNVRHIAR